MIEVLILFFVVLIIALTVIAFPIVVLLEQAWLIFPFVACLFLATIFSFIIVWIMRSKP